MYTITKTSKSGEDNLGIQFSGVAKKISKSRYDLARKHYLKRNKPEPKEVGDILDGDSWYIIIPDKIELIDEKNFSFEKQTLDL